MRKDDAAFHAAEMAVEVDRLLPGEKRDTSHLDDAQHWLAVYTELMEGKAAAISATRASLAAMKELAARHEVEVTDLIVLDREMSRFRAAVDFWSGRIAELGRRERH